MRMYIYTEEKVDEGILRKAEYHIIVKCTTPEDFQSDETIKFDFEKYMVRKLADKMMMDIMEGFGDRGITASDLHRYISLTKKKKEE